MLTQYTIENFKSFKESTTVDLHATNYKILSDTNVDKNGILKGAIFVGANASGKSNLLEALHFLLKLLFSKNSVTFGSNTCLFCNNPILFLEFKFSIDGSTIQYSFEYNRHLSKIVKEELNQDGRLLLNRIANSAESKITETKTYENIDDNSLFLREIYFNTKFREFPVLKRWFEFLKNSVYIDLYKNILENFDDSEFELSQYFSKHGTDEINNFFNNYGFNQSIEYTSETHGSFVSYKVKDDAIFFRRNGIDEPIIFAMESLGNKNLLRLLPVFFHVVNQGGILLLDEFSSGFHNELEELLIRYFMQNAHNSQLIFVSHSTNLLTNSLLRPDQEYAVEFNDNHGSTIRRFSSEKPREAQNVEKMYQGGVFGGLPNYKRKNNA